MTHHAVRIHQHGGPEALSYEAVDVPDPGAGEVRLAQTAVGLNYIDVYHRTGLYPVPGLPCTLGMEAAGTVAAVGPDVTDVCPGDRVAYAAPPLGAYADARIMPADRVVPLPTGISDRQAAAMMLQGMTVEYLIRRVFPVQPGMPVLFHAAAGGVGLIACQWLNAIGATVIGTVGSRDKADTARAHGCHHPIVYTEEDFTERVREITGGEGVPVVYDGVGAATWDGSLACLRRRGMMVSFGNASGAVTEFNPGELAKRGSLFLTRPTLMDYTADRQDLLDSANALFEVVQRGDVVVEINQTYSLSEAAQAHRDLEARRTTGSTILLP
ncbi:NADPH:quinone reductase [Limimonas halophila]|uniref:NADPH:quinone reductase n=1 Tax=Limimonas halophila TaxID=1082479 RepID=A0A1G7SMF1_9PROT|nr:quinone oxidoreductase [Limimonas halophila]SDG24277.1 NADPH:quinone reductase [Limimonas halophila]